MSLDQKLDEIFSKLNGSGDHACYCERSTDGGCTCALKDEYLEEAKTALSTLLIEARIDENEGWLKGVAGRYPLLREAIPRRIAELRNPKGGL